MSASGKTLPDLSDWQGHLIICGLQNRGYRILQQLLDAHLKVVVVDNNPDKRFTELAEQAGVPVIQRDSRNEQTLLDAGLMRCIALIAVTANDLYNLETILTVQKLRPGLRVVASFKNRRIGEQINKSKANNAVALNASQLAAPTFITASISRQVLHFFNLEGQELVVVSDNVGSSGTIQELYTQLTVVMRRRKITKINDGITVDEYVNELCPPPSITLKPGDEVFLIGTEEQLRQKREIKITAEQFEEVRTRKKPAKPKNEGIGVRGFIGGLWRDIDRPLRKTLGILSLILLISTIFFYVLELIRNDWNFGRANPISAFYTVLRGMGSELEFNDERLANLRLVSEIYTAALIIVGTALLGIVYAYITNFIITARLSQALGLQKATTMSNHIVIVGLGSIGYEVMRNLVREKGRKVVVLEVDEENRYVPLARNMGVPVVHADARVPESLDLVNISKATCLTVMTDDDMVNLETAINARSRFPKNQLPIVMRIFDTDLADRSEDTFNISTVRSTSALLAPYFIAAALQFETITTFYAAQKPFFVAKIEVKSGSNLDGSLITDTYRRAKVLVIAFWGAPVLKHNPLEGTVKVRPTLKPVLNPEPKQTLRTGDTIYCVGQIENLLLLYGQNQPYVAVRTVD
jgi:Trk K+ transport system NAD-binding subunit